MKNKHHSMRMLVKSVSDDGTFEGLLSPYGNVDDGGDVVEVGAFTKSLADNGSTVPMLWQHKMDCPIGELTLDDRADGLYCSGKFLLDIPEAQKAYALLKAQIIRGLSIGYETVKSQMVNGVRHLKELRLYEGSVVTFPMNPSALISSVKSREAKGDFVEELNDRQLSDVQDQMFSALRNALYPLVWSGLSRADIVSTAETTIQQFQSAYLDYLPDYLDYLSREYGIDTKSWSGKREAKEGRKLSATTRSTLCDAHEHIKSAADVLDSLLCDEDDDIPGDDEDDDEVKSAATLLNSMRSLLA